MAAATASSIEGVYEVVLPIREVSAANSKVVRSPRRKRVELDAIAAPSLLAYLMTVQTFVRSLFLH